MSIFTKGIVVIAASTCLAAPAAAQMLYLNPSPDVPLSYGFPDAIPNGGSAFPQIRAITGFGTVYGYGSSSTNLRGAPLVRAPGSPTGIAGNTPYQYIELLAPQVGADFRRGNPNVLPTATSFADGGATTTTGLFGSPVGCTLMVNCTLQPQVEQFKRLVGRYNANDIVVHWLGVNDFTNTTTRAILETKVSTYIDNNTEIIRQNLALGARQYVFLGMSDFSKLTNYSLNSDSALLVEANQRVNAGMVQNLIAFKQANPGANLHYFDFDRLVNQIRANPTAYGFSPAGTADNVGCVRDAPRLFGAACTSLTFAQQNSFLSYDGLHWTYRYHDLMSLAITNQLLAPYTLAAQADLTDATAQAFSNSLVRRLDGYRTTAMLAGLVSADLPVKARPQAPGMYGPWSVYVEGLYAAGDRPDRPGAGGMNYNVGGVTLGIDYRFSPNFLVGAAFNYSNPTANLNNAWGHLSADAYQFAGYAAWTYPNWFANLAVSGGFDNIKVIRPGLISPLSGNPDGDSFVVQGKTGYLFDIAALGVGQSNASALKAGPIVGFTYSRVHIDAYTEVGDPLLTQAIGRQTSDGFTGRAGVEIRSAYLWNTWKVSPWLAVTVEHDFEDGARVLTTAQTYALALTIGTPVSNLTQTYGRVAGGLSAQVAQSVYVNLSGEATFARSDSNDYALTGGVKVVW